MIESADMTNEQDGGLGFDPEALRAKYAAERDKRVRRDGRDQYVEASGRFAHYGRDDPYADPGYTREALNDELEVVIIGGGFGGLSAAARLREAGIDNIRIIEVGADYGGTWYWNRYPGAQCDVESYIYLPLLEETGYMPAEKYAYAPEIFAHTQRVAQHFGLYDVACFQTRVESLRWDETLKRWHVLTDRGDDMKARFVIIAAGPANRPKLPGIPGLDDFEGRAFHTARWDYDYTGGDTHGGLTKLADKKVAVIGTGATAIQVVPHVGRDAEHLYVFQRTPSSVDVRSNRPTDPAWAASLQPGWQRERQDNFNAILSGQPVEVDLVADMWTDSRRYMSIIAAETGGTPESIEAMMAMSELADMQKMNDVRARVDSLIERDDVAERLKPWYPRYCKRPTFHDDYLPTFNRQNVTLVDTSASHGVERITPTGLVANGVEYQIDCIIFATGFEITTGVQRTLSVTIEGEGGETLVEHWANGPSTFHGYTMRGFPNLFFLGSGQNGLSANYTSMLGEQARHLAYVIGEARSRGAATVQPRQEAENEWVATIRALNGLTIQMLEVCTPGYYNNEGHIDETGGGGRGLAEIYTPGLNQFNVLLEAWRDEGQLRGLQLEPAIAVAASTATAQGASA